jgi:hypothetical protein
LQVFSRSTELSIVVYIYQSIYLSNILYFQLLLLLEIISFKAISQMMWEGSPREPGDYCFDPCGVCKNKTQEYKNNMALKELKNGRLAMLAFSGIVTQAVLTGKDFPF